MLMCPPPGGMEPVDHLGVETATDHQQENAAVGLAGIEPDRRTAAKHAGKGLKSRIDIQVTGQQVGGPQRKDSDRQADGRAIDQLSHGAVAAGRHQRPQVAGPPGPVGGGGDRVEVGEDVDAELVVAQDRGQPLDGTAGRARPGTDWPRSGQGRLRQWCRRQPGP